MSETELDCCDCIHKKVCDDGDNIWNIWCSKQPLQGIDEEFDNTLKESCSFFVYDEGMMH